MVNIFFFFFLLYVDHRDLHVLTHSFPTRRTSDLSFSCLGGEGCRHRYLVTGIQPATGDELALAATQIDMLAIDMLRPTMVVAIGEEQEEQLLPDADASVKQVGKQSWTQHRQALEDRNGMLKAEALRYVRHQLDRGALRESERAHDGTQVNNAQTD